MAGSLQAQSPSDSWQTHSGDDEDFNPSASLLSQTSAEETSDGDVYEDTEGTQEGEEDEEVEGEDDDGQGQTIYFDAEDGIFRDEDGDEIDLQMDIESTNDEEEEGEEEVDEEEDDEEEEEEEEETGAQTPRQASQSTDAARPPRPVQTITSTSISTTLLNSTPSSPGQLQRFTTAVQRQILQLLRHPGIRGILQPQTRTTRSATRRANADGDDDDDDDDEEDDDLSFIGFSGRRRRRKPVVDGPRYPPIPSLEGKGLMFDGTFGHSDRCDHTACGQPFSQPVLGKRKRLSRQMLDREMGVQNRGRQRLLNPLVTQTLIPGSKADLIINMDARCYSGQFSEDGSFFFACGQDYKVRMYDTTNPYDWKYYKTVHFYGGQWTITDATLSPDNKYLAYSSIRSQICLAATDQSDHSEPTMLDFSDMGGGGHGFAGGGAWGRSRGHFGIWSLRFSGDGREIVAGTSDESVYVYDLESRRSILRIPAHGDDVNAVCFGDKMSPHILYSGSDDTTLKVWDRRSLSSMRPAGLFLGHTEGLTYIDSKGDGRYVISNAKDQTCKLWDLRKMISTDEGEKINPQDYTTNFDYRFAPYKTSDHVPHPHDCSLVTFRGHRVLKTLIRCHFSPPGSSDGRYIYSGSHDGKIYVWNLDGTTASEPINVLAATKNSRPASDERYANHMDYYGREGVWKTIVRDCSWHPHAPVIAATSWNGWDHGLGTCTVHTWTDGVDADEVGSGRDGFTGANVQDFRHAKSLGSMPMGARVTPQLRHDDRFYAREPVDGQTRRSTRSGGGGLGTLWTEAGEEDDDDDDDENGESYEEA